VFSARQFQIGYVASERAVLLGKLMREGRELFAVFQETSTWGAVARIGVDGVPVVLPQALANRRGDEYDEYCQLPDQDFYPDEIPPDE
jgi:hypothetical protein